MGAPHNTLILPFLLFILPFVFGGWTQTFADEFNAQTKLNTAVWNSFYRFSPEVANSELQYYAPDAFVPTSTTMKLVAQKRTTVSTQTFSYTSGLITTSHKFNQTYGYFEMRAKFPSSIGFWPAFWLLPENADAAGAQEIDIIEMVMDLPKTLFFTFHCNYTTSGPTGGSKTYATYDLNAFHTYGVQWLPKWLIWYVDGVQVFNMTSSCVPNKPAYILANLAVGGDWPAPPNSNTVFPSSLEIDYIRAYQYSPTGSSLTGPGAGISYTALSDPNPNIRVRFPTSSPETAAIGQTVTVSAVIVTNSVAYTGSIVQFVFYNTARTEIGQTYVTVNAPAFSSVTASTTWTIPTTATNGTFITWALGVYSNGWSTTIFWDESASVIGVNRIVGRSATL